MNIFFIGVVVSILVYIVVGIWAGRSVKDVNDYYVSGRNAPTILIAGTLFASMLSVNGFMGDQGWCYSGNITTLVLLNSMCAMGYIAGPLMFGRYLRRSECTTMPEYFGARYCNLKNRRVAGIITAVSLTAYLLSCITGVGILMQELTGLSYELCLFLAWFCFTAFTFYSGSKGVILTDTMMFMVFLIATIIAGPYVFKAQGGIGHLLENLMNNPNIPENLLDYHGNIPGAGATDVFGAVMYAVTMGIIWFITVSVSPWQAGRNMMAKSEHVTFRAGAIAAACTVIFLMYLNLQSVTVLNLNPGMEDPQRVLIWAAFHVMPKPKNTENATNATLLDSIKAMGVAFKCPVTYLLAGMIFCGSMCLASTTYFAPYLQNICGLPVKIGVLYSNYSKIVTQLIAASAAGILATKLKRSTKPMIVAGVVGAGLYIVMEILPASTAVMWPMLVVMTVALMMIYVFRALYYATVDEEGTPKNIVGSVIGISSLIGFIPDTFYTSLCGKWLEADPVGGYKKIFLSCILAMVIGLVCAFISDRRIVKFRAANNKEA